MAMPEAYTEILEGIDRDLLVYHYDVCGGSVEVSTHDGYIVVVTAPEMVNLLVAPDSDLRDHWVLSKESPMGDIMDPQMAVRTAGEARSLLVSWVLRA